MVMTDYDSQQDGPSLSHVEERWHSDDGVFDGLFYKYIKH